MNKLLILGGLALAGLAAAWAPLATSQDEDPMAALPQPGPHHRMIASRVGEWDAALTMHVTGMPPQTIEGRETSVMFGPFFLVSDFSGSYMGTEFDGRSTLGYDPVNGEFQGTWMDAMAPTMMMSRGSWDEDSNSIVSYYEQPNMFGVMEKMKSVQHIADPDHHSYIAYRIDDEGEHLQMEIQYTRRKAER